MKDIKKITVKYKDKVVGYLSSTQRGICFQYDENWIKDGFSISPLSLPLDYKLHYEETNTFKGLFGVFQDSLPDGWGELLIRRMLFKKGIDYGQLTPLQKLMLINNDGLGALTYHPSESFDNPNLHFNIDEIAESAKHIYDEKNENKNDLDIAFLAGGSSGGARPKAHIKINNDFYIVKFLCSSDDKNNGLLEYQANMDAKKCQIQINECKIFESKICKGYFGAKRFDRDNKGNRIHMISFSSLLEISHWIPTLDYKILIQVVKMICKDKQDIYEAYRRACFNVLYHNRDDHGKNFSFLYDEQLKGYRLSPAYDINKSSHMIEHQMMVCGNGKPTEEDLIKLAKETNLSMDKCLEIIKKIKEVLKIK